MPGKYGFGNSRKKSPFKLKGMDFGVGTGSSPLNKYKSDAQRKAVHASKADKSPMKKVKPDYPDIDGDGNRKESMKKAAADKKSPLNRRSADERIARAVEKGNVKKAARISARQAKKGKTKVAPTATPVNDASMKNYNKAVDARTGGKNKAGTKIQTTKPQADKSKTVAKPTVKKTIKKVPTKRGTGVTYKAAWEADKGGVQSKYKNYAAFEKAAKDYNRAKDSQKASTGVMKSDVNKKKPAGPQNKK